MNLLDHQKEGTTGFAGVSWGYPSWEKIFNRFFLTSEHPEIGVFAHCEDWVYAEIEQEIKPFRGRSSFKLFRRNFESCK